MASFILKRVRGTWVLGLTAASFAYGWLIILVLPYWERLVAAQGGRELQTRLLYGAAEAGEALAAIDAQARADAFAFYALDAPNALLYATAIAAMIAFGLRQLGWEATAAKWLIALPLLSGGADLAENACLAAALSNDPASPGALGDAAGVLTTIKFGAGIPAQILAVAFVLVGLGVWAWRKVTAAA